MLYNANISTAFSITLSGLLIISYITIVAKLRIEIDNFYQEFLDEINEFNDITNDAWNKIIKMDRKVSYKNKVKKNINLPKFSQVFQKTNKLLDHCTCSFAKSDCPAGPRGPKGQDGLPGQKGEKGSTGKPGIDGSALIEILYPNECILCPPGLIGEPGFQGKIGLPGVEGAQGEPGQTMGRGKKGLVGLPGNEGGGGSNGLPGNSGLPGASGILGKQGLKGKKGNQGESGEIGLPGKPGIDGVVGGTGNEGSPGDLGLPGIPGSHGLDGINGIIGFPGQDAQYCSCPDRASIIEFAQKNKEYQELVAVTAAATKRRFITI